MDRLRACLKAASLVCILPTAAAAEDWYPSLCLGPDVCARVDAISWAEPVDGGGPRLVVSAEGATATVRRAFVTLEAADTSMHVCMRYDPFGDLEVTCLMVPHLGY